MFTIVLYSVLYAWIKCYVLFLLNPCQLHVKFILLCLCLMLCRILVGCHVAQAQLMQYSLAAVKASMLVVQQSQEPISTAVLSASSNQSDLSQALSGLLNCYACVLTDGIVKTIYYIYYILQIKIYQLILYFMYFSFRRVCSSGSEHCWDGCCFTY